jgi:hypothetical protein
MNRNVIIIIVMVVLVLVLLAFCALFSCVGVTVLRSSLFAGPSDVPVYPGAKFAGQSSGTGKIDLGGFESISLSEYIFAQYHAPGHVATEEIESFYKREMPKQGWTEDQGLLRTSHLLKFSKDNGQTICYIHIGLGLSGAQLIDIYRGKP